METSILCPICKDLQEIDSDKDKAEIYVQYIICFCCRVDVVENASSGYPTYPNDDDELCEYDDHPDNPDNLLPER